MSPWSLRRNTSDGRRSCTPLEARNGPALAKILRGHLLAKRDAVLAERMLIVAGMGREE
ncbi:hypothetical protein [Paraburkholderia tagetis]|uniref:Uncharacterized protein n=1 Tax=Paraburkholderia tagetis TaxID=2913261 RepID=A0A9X1ULQ0_9BURK|nr:hypothetical protein [Paraburkholderia tagetis]MCG5077701.1 hypothetical protein [Paraburkholderia tagetis]